MTVTVPHCLPRTGTGRGCGHTPEPGLLLLVARKWGRSAVKTELSNGGWHKVFSARISGEEGMPGPGAPSVPAVGSLQTRDSGTWDAGTGDTVCFPPFFVFFADWQLDSTWPCRTQALPSGYSGCG